MKLSTYFHAKFVALVALGIFSGIAQAAGHLPPQTNGGYSAPVLFNSANSFAREGKPGLAILNYERARLLAPADPDIRANLNFVRDSAALPAMSESWLARGFEIANPNTLYWLGCGGLLFVGMALLAARLLPRQKLVRRAAAVVGVALVVVAVCDAIALRPVINEAVVVGQTVPARAAPVSSDEPLFAIPEAEVVTMNAERGDFVLVQTNAGRQGWVSRRDLVPIVPRDVEPASL